jgi:uncharacterized protein
LGKLLTLILVIVVVWRLMKGFGRKRATRNAPQAAPEQMVNCDYCGVYLPHSEALAEAGKFFCCAEHRRRAG